MMKSTPMKLQTKVVSRVSRILIPSLVLIASISFAEEHTILQQNQQFSVEALTIKVGDTVHFQNQDDIFHNVFSLSDIITFDLGSYPKGESKAVVFDTPGEVEVECAIHPEMFMTVTVE